MAHALSLSHLTFVTTIRIFHLFSDRPPFPCTSIIISSGCKFNPEVAPVASTCLCKLEEGFSFPGTVQVTDDAVDDAVAALQVGEAGHGAGAAAHLAEGALDDIGGAHLDPVGLRHGEKV